MPNFCNNNCFASCEERTPQILSKSAQQIKIYEASCSEDQREEEEDQNNMVEKPDHLTFFPSNFFPQLFSRS